MLLLCAVVEPGIVEFMIERLVAALFVLLVVECDHVNDGLRVFLLLLLCDAVGFERLLPFSGKALK